MVEDLEVLEEVTVEVCIGVVEGVGLLVEGFLKGDELEGCFEVVEGVAVEDSLEVDEEVVMEGCFGEVEVLVAEGCFEVVEVAVEGF